MLKVLVITLIIALTVILGGGIVLGRLSRRGVAPGLVAGKLAACPDKPNCVSSDATDTGHAIAPLVFDSKEVSPQVAWEKVQGAVKDLPGTVITKVTETYLSAESASRIFGFVDDLELRLIPERGEIAVRSASRVGRSDLGANRKRVELLRARFSERLP